MVGDRGFRACFALPVAGHISLPAFFVSRSLIAIAMLLCTFLTVAVFVSLPGYK